jgi:beta-xylosidase
MLTYLFFAILLSNPSEQKVSEATYTNPVWNKNFPDPFILEDGGVYYAYGTQNSPNGFQVMSSKDLVSWKHLGSVGLPEWADGQLWAPEVYKWKGKWYMFYSALDRESRKRDLAVSIGDSPTGPFKFVAKLVIGKSENPGKDDNGAIDPTLHIEDGKPYLLYIREAPPRSVKIVALSDDLAKTITPAKVLIPVDREIEKGILDAPTLVKRDGTFWLFYSSGWFQSYKRDACYQVWAAPSKSLMGPYLKPAKPLLTTKLEETYSPGHQCVLKLPSGEWWMAYHAWNSTGEPLYGHNPEGRTLRIDRLEWAADGPKCSGPTTSPQAVPGIKK